MILKGIAFQIPARFVTIVPSRMMITAAVGASSSGMASTRAFSQSSRTMPARMLLGRYLRPPFHQKLQPRAFSAAGPDSYAAASPQIWSPKRSILCSRGAVLPLLPSSSPRHFGSSPERQERQNVRAGAASGAAADFPQQGSPDAPGSPLSSKAEEDMSIGDHGALHAIDIAIAVNFAIFVAKLAVYFASGSSSMLAEAVHSIADIMNQALLRTGVMKSLQAPTLQHPYGYTRDRFVWSLISAVGIFCLGSGVSIVHGLNSLGSQHAVEHLGWGLTVLGVSFVLEGFSLYVALRMVMKSAAARGVSLMEFVKRGADPTSIAIVMEDAAAVVGLVIAGVCTTAAHVTGSAVYDAAGSILVGTLLGFVAVTLIRRNRDLLIGRSMSNDTMYKLMEHLKADPVVKAVYDAKSEEIGTGIYRFKAEIDFCGDTLVKRYLERSGRSILHDKIRAATARDDSNALDVVLREYGTEVVTALAKEVDRIEMELRVIEPGLKHLDLEADRRPLIPKSLIGASLRDSQSEAGEKDNMSITSNSVDYWDWDGTTAPGTEAPVVRKESKSP